MVLKAATKSRFNNPDLHVQSWYVAARSKEIGLGKARSFSWLDRQVTLFRDLQGALHALDAHCPHLGADLADGQVVEGGIRCALHHWCFDFKGRCTAAPGLKPVPQRQVRSYPVVERWGLAWVFNGPKALFEMPQVELESPHSSWGPYLYHTKAHPHVVAVNPFDFVHFNTLHRIRCTAPMKWSQPTPHTSCMDFQGRLPFRWQRFLTGSEKQDMKARFWIYGGNLSWIRAYAPVPFELGFANRPTEGGGTEIFFLLFLKKWPGLDLIRALLLTDFLVGVDRKILDHQRFVPNFTAADGALRDCVRQVNEMKVW